MGKGEIISHTGDGQYQIKYLYDTTSKEASIACIDVQVAALEEHIKQLKVLIECQP
jgi:hypothetical protein